MISVNNIQIKPTIFPDGTSQIWKLPPEVLEVVLQPTIEVKWDYEEEREIIWVCQLGHLLYTEAMKVNGVATMRLNCPYLPYARQDKNISNESCGALYTMLYMLSEHFSGLTVFDVHNADFLVDNYFFYNDLVLEEPTKEIKFAYDDSGSDMICYPDAGAEKRYKHLVDYCPHDVVLEKVRDQLTGQITSIKRKSPVDVTGCNILLADDICDGGRTFVEAAKLLIAAGAAQVNLYISHGLFTHSDGVNYLHDNGIINVYDKNGLVSVARRQTMVYGQHGIGKSSV